MFVLCRLFLLAPSEKKKKKNPLMLFKMGIDAATELVIGRKRACLLGCVGISAIWTLLFAHKRLSRVIDEGFISF